MNDAQKALAMRLLAQLLKILLLWLSTKLPQLLPAVAVDGLVAQLAPVVTAALCVAWSAAQHYLDQAAKQLAVELAAKQSTVKGP